MRYTECDLSFDEVKLDYKALILSLKLAVRYSVEEIELNEKRLTDAISVEDVTLIHLCGERILTASTYLSKTTEVLSALLGMQTRENIEIVNI